MVEGCLKDAVLGEVGGFVGRPIALRLLLHVLAPLLAADLRRAGYGDDKDASYGCDPEGPLQQHGLSSLKKSTAILFAQDSRCRQM